MFQILRDIIQYEYDNPYKMECTRILFIYNPVGGKPTSFVHFSSKKFLTGLQAKDSEGKNLSILPSELVPMKIRTQATQIGGVSVVIKLSKPIKPGKFEEIQLTFFRNLQPPEIDVEYEILGLFGYANYTQEIDSSDTATYFYVLAPDDYRLDLEVQQTSGGSFLEIYRDENTARLRFPKSRDVSNVSWKIGVPKRTWIWLFFGALYGLIALFSSLPVYWLTQLFPVSVAILTSSIGALLVMRAWIFISVQLLDRLNWLYIVLFITNILALIIICYLHCSGFFLPTSDPPNSF